MLAACISSSPSHASGDAFALPQPSDQQTQAIAAADLLALRVERDVLMGLPPYDWLPSAMTFAVMLATAQWLHRRQIFVRV